MTAQARPGDPRITPELVRQHGLTPEEFSRIRTMLGRDPTWVELGIFSALWSEHCAYKHSRPILKSFPTEGPQVVQGPGENAGVLRLGEGWAVAFKMESHNHPSAVEPYQGAATGVGGILRDIFTMGARPVAVLDSLRFGPLDSDRQRYLMKGVVRGIGDYGNCVGVPTVGGDVAFETAYEGNPLVNAMAVGLLREEELIRARAAGAGNPIIAVGARTGRDGIHGASFASEELSEQSEARRPQVQVGDPFTEKLLIEASLELIRSGHIVAIQDMGAAGLTSSSAEMAARGGVGVEIDAQLVPAREAEMTPYEILLSESQERMLVVAKRGRERDVDAICRAWELTSAVIGRVTDDGMYRVRWGAEVVAEIPGQALVEGAPVYRPEARESAEAVARRARPVPLPPPDLDLNGTLEQLLDLPTIASKRWVYEQYDTSVQTNTVAGPGGDAAVLRVRDTSLGIALTSGGSGRFVWLDPYEGGKAVVAEAARNIAATGARPLGITDCLNFGNPQRPEVFYQFREACRGIADACRALGTPVTGGNVSFYNESPTGSVLPSPMIGMVGVLRQIECRVPAQFRAAGDAVICLGATRGALGGSQDLSLATGEVFGEFAFMQRALLGGVLVAMICALVGTYVVLRGLAFVGDALAHAAFPGVVIAYLLKGNIHLGAAVFALATALGIGLISRRSRMSYDTSIGILFAGAFALGVLLMSTIKGYTVDLFSFLFGNILGISGRDLLFVGLLGAVLVLVIALFYKELLLLSFDPIVAEAMGYPVQALNYLLLALIALTIVISIQAVGIILVVALLVTPSATAYLLTERLFRMMLLGIALAVLAAVVGLYISYYLNVASGAAIVLVSTCLFFVVLAGRRLTSRGRASA